MLDKALQQYGYRIHLQRTGCNMLRRTKAYGNSVVNEQKKVFSIADREDRTFDLKTQKTRSGSHHKRSKLR